MSIHLLISRSCLSLPMPLATRLVVLVSRMALLETLALSLDLSSPLPLLGCASFVVPRFGQRSTRSVTLLLLVAAALAALGSLVLVAFQGSDEEMPLVCLQLVED